jgi:hypothetical protein
VCAVRTQPVAGAGSGPAVHRWGDLHGLRHHDRHLHPGNGAQPEARAPDEPVRHHPNRPAIVGGAGQRLPGANVGRSAGGATRRADRRGDGGGGAAGGIVAVLEAGDGANPTESRVAIIPQMGNSDIQILKGRKDNYRLLKAGKNGKGRWLDVGWNFKEPNLHNRCHYLPMPLRPNQFYYISELQPRRK